jgi:glyceraldehyde 3-phosphate dehydrogenase
VAAPVKEGGALNVVMGVNDHLYEPDDAPPAHRRLLHHQLPGAGGEGHPRGHRHPPRRHHHHPRHHQHPDHLDAPHKDLRRARASSLSLIPTSTGSATAIALIFPELKGKLNGLAVRVPLLNASLTDCVFEVARPTTVEEVNALLERADGPLRASWATRTRPLVSVDLPDDPRSAIVDALSTMVVNGTSVKMLRLVRQRDGAT